MLRGCILLHSRYQNVHCHLRWLLSTRRDKRRYNHKIIITKCISSWLNMFTFKQLQYQSCFLRWSSASSLLEVIGTMIQVFPSGSLSSPIVFSISHAARAKTKVSARYPSFMIYIIILKNESLKWHVNLYLFHKFYESNIWFVTFALQEYIFLLEFLDWFCHLIFYIHGKKIVGNLNRIQNATL